MSVLLSSGAFFGLGDKGDWGIEGQGDMVERHWIFNEISRLAHFVSAYFFPQKSQYETIKIYK